MYVTKSSDAAAAATAAAAAADVPVIVDIPAAAVDVPIIVVARVLLSPLPSPPLLPKLRQMDLLHGMS
jgi:hypothetical protein